MDHCDDRNEDNHDLIDLIRNRWKQDREIINETMVQKLGSRPKKITFLADMSFKGRIAK